MCSSVLELLSLHSRNQDLRTVLLAWFLGLWWCHPVSFLLFSGMSLLYPTFQPSLCACTCLCGIDWWPLQILFSAWVPTGSLASPSEGLSPAAPSWTCWWLPPLWMGWSSKDSIAPYSCPSYVVAMLLCNALYSMFPTRLWHSQGQGLDLILCFTNTLPETKEHRVLENVCQVNK